MLPAHFPSPFREAILTLDGVGEWSTSSLSIGNQNKITSLRKSGFSFLGIAYSAFTQYTGSR